jgi:glycosyltransferase involved in cell wall biosynthesis
VIPIRDRPEHLERLLAALKGMRCIVVDDASTDPGRTRDIAQRAGVRLVALTTNSGPAAARNAGLAQVSTPLVAFIDSDCVPTTGWLEPLLGHFDDPMVAAAAPRIVPLSPRRATALSRYEAVRSSLDLGDAGGLVRPLSRLPYVPSAALMVRREAVGDAKTSIWRGDWSTPDGTSATNRRPPCSTTGPGVSAHGCAAGPSMARPPGPWPTATPGHWFLCKPRPGPPAYGLWPAPAGRSWPGAR